MTDLETLLDWLATVSHDPLAFVLGAFPWGEPETILEHEPGPEVWQTKVLNQIRDYLSSGGSVDGALQLAVASGHGIGKSTLVAWIILWAMTTLPDTLGVVTANTETQLRTKTWTSLGKWYNLFIAKDFFRLTATSLFQPEHERTWRIDMVPWSEKNTEAFAGLHNKGRRVILLFDEASAIPDVIWEVSEGALTDANTQIIWAVFGNPTRNTGRFRECAPGRKHGKYWHFTSVDSRTVRFTNKAQIDRWIELYGEDSDFCRIRIYGQFPSVGEMEFFSSADVEAAMHREVYVALTDPLALGVDVARFGKNSSVIFPRKGRDARTIPREVYKGIDTVSLAAKTFDAGNRLRADGIFIDGGGVGGGVVDNCRRMHMGVFEIQFGAKPDQLHHSMGIAGERYANKRAEMYGALRAWLKTGSIPHDDDLLRQFTAITYTLNRRDEIQLIAKEDMDESPDDLDALALTFALPIAAHDHAGGDYPDKPLVESEYNPLAFMTNDYNPLRAMQ